MSRLVLHDQFAEEGRSLLGDALPEQEAILRVEERVGVGLVEATEFEPLTGEVPGEAFGARVGEQAIDLSPEDGRLAERAIPGGR